MQYEQRPSLFSVKYKYIYIYIYKQRRRVIYVSDISCMLVGLFVCFGFFPFVNLFYVEHEVYLLVSNRYVDICL